MKNHLILSLVILVFCISALGQTDSKNLPKLTAEEIIAKHVASIGKAESIAAIKSRILVGVGVFTTKQGAGKIGGPAQFATDGQRMVLAVVLNSNDYPFEKMAYDGKD